MSFDDLLEIINNVYYTEELANELGAELKELLVHLEDLRDGPRAAWADEKLVSEIVHLDSKIFNASVAMQEVRDMIHKYLKKG